MLNPETRNSTSRARERTLAVVRRRWLRELLFEDWTLKLVALIVTLGLWFGVTAQRTPAAMRVRGVALSFLLPEDMEISNDPRDQVEVTLGGEKNKLDDLIVRNLVVTVDVRGYQEGERVARLVPESVTMDVPDGVRVIKIEPGTVALKLERRVERAVEVAARLGGRPAEGFEVRAVETTPARVNVRGPASHVARLERAPTETISLDGRRDSFTLREVAIDIEDEKVVPLEGVVGVRVVIEEPPTAERRFTNVSARPQQAREQNPAATRTVTVVLRGPRSVIEALTSEELHVEWLAAGATLVPRVALPPELIGRVEVVAVEPGRLISRSAATP